MQNDELNLRAHYGWAVYQRSFALPVGNDAGTAFMGSDNANVPAVVTLSEDGTATRPRIDAEIDKRPWFIGEQLWNFADFATFQGIIRVEGNRKGILTRDRQPKMAAHWLRDRCAGIPDYGYKGL
ncbi:glycoside hydrolase family 2 TIM barrel-domain containing protein [Bifidobacterium ruminantium]|uniref:glycoside hydrolase family 2 TIM barrel-domain containing protein n=1 Tax=Bifidobacterium ruminantium TaxID=78346 RepID=UPI00047EBC4E|nr:glycoside hydrolase family 2 TIM barrel-domain containing protein [Bifidobacterium ruminantium]